MWQVKLKAFNVPVLVSKKDNHWCPLRRASVVMFFHLFASDLSEARSKLLSIIGSIIVNMCNTQMDHIVKHLHFEKNVCIATYFD